MLNRYTHKHISIQYLMFISGLRVNERMTIKTNVEIFGRQFAENGKYIVERLPGRKDA